MIEAIEVDPNFLPGSSASLEKYSEEVSAPTGSVTFVFTDVQNSTKVREGEGEGREERREGGLFC